MLNFLISASKNKDCGYLLELPHRGVLTSTFNLCLECKYEKKYHIGITCITVKFLNFGTQKALL